MLRRKFLMAVAAAAVAGLLGPASARAGFVVRVELLNVSTGASVATLDGDTAAGTQDFHDRFGATNPTSNDLNLTQGNITVQGNSAFGISGLDLTINADSTHGVANSKLNQVETTVTNASGADQRIRVTVTDTDYNGPPVGSNPLLLIGSAVYNNIGTSGLSFATNGTGGWTAYGDTTNQEFGTAGATSINVATPTTDAIVGTRQAFWNRGTSPYSLTMVMDFTLANGGSVTGLTGTVNVVPAVPAPATAILALAGAPIFGAFGWMRRRKAVVA